MNLIESIDRLLGGDLTEARKEEFEYDEEFKTKTAKQNNDQSKRTGTKTFLSNKALGQLSTTCSKLGKNLIQTKALAEEYEALKATLDEKMTAMADDIFDAEDALYTRIMETEMLVVSINKETQRKTTTFNAEAFWEKVAESGVGEDILANMKSLYEMCHDVKYATIKSAVKTSLKEGVVTWTIEKFKSAIRAILKTFKQTDKRIQETLLDLNNQFKMEVQ
jgi:hypothetical protein